ncbi:MAG TPA: DUF3606 domain-containing protein [Polyangiaceae bacterium]|nr:DUF3606 domain-containing protein [Polyangiaceae bacterium]
MQTSRDSTAADAKVDLREPTEIAYLAKKYGVTTERVREVATQVGPSFSAIEAELSRTDPHAPE